MKLISSITTLAVLTSAPLQAYNLHEWGTFTTVSGSDGILLTGLQREEEHLPPFVRHHPGFNNNGPGFPNFPGLMMKRMPVPARNVKVKMETPVIYFHSDEGFRANVKVEFKGGTISQWYPDRSGGETLALNDPKTPANQRYIDFAKPYLGSIEWEVDVLSPEESRNAILFKPDDLVQWTRARIPEANAVRTSSGETEGFLFYRGLGSFGPGLKTTISSDETLHLTNHTPGEIPYLLVYERMADGTARWTEHKGLAKGAEVSFKESEITTQTEGRIDEKLYHSLAGNLADQGLLQSEAEAMVQTWWNSYFDAPGLRVFWVLPDQQTDDILPLEVTPAPENTVRVMVGRSEVIRPRKEQEWLAQANSKDEGVKSSWQILAASDRFGEAYAQRIQALQQQAKR